MFSKSEFPVSILVLDIRYKHPESQNNNLLYLFNNQLDYALVNYIAKSETTKNIVDKFLSNLLIKSITKKLSYCNINE